MAVYITFSAPFLRSTLPPDTKILIPRINFRVKKADIDNQYYLYSRTCTYGSSMLEGVDFTVSYAPVVGIFYLHVIIAIVYSEGLINFVLDLSNAIQNTIIPNTSKRVYLKFPHLYLEWFKRTLPEHLLAAINQNNICIQ